MLDICLWPKGMKLLNKAPKQKNKNETKKERKEKNKKEELDYVKIKVGNLVYEQACAL